MMGKQRRRAGAQLSHEEYQSAGNTAPLLERRLTLMSHLESCLGPVLPVRLNPTLPLRDSFSSSLPLSKVNIYQRAQVPERKMYLGDGTAGLELSQKYENWSDFLLMVAAVTSVFLPGSSRHSLNHAAGVGGASSWALEKNRKRP